MEEEVVGTFSDKNFETNPVHERVTQPFGGGWIGTDFLQSLEGQETLAVVQGAGNSHTSSKVLFSLKTFSMPRNVASSYGGKSERDQADTTF